MKKNRMLNRIMAFVMTLTLLLSIGVSTTAAAKTTSHKAQVTLMAKKVTKKKATKKKAVKKKAAARKTKKKVHKAVSPARSNRTVYVSQDGRSNVYWYSWAQLKKHRGKIEHRVVMKEKVAYAMGKRHSKLER